MLCLPVDVNKIQKDLKRPKKGRAQLNNSTLICRWEYRAWKAADISASAQQHPPLSSHQDEKKRKREREEIPNKEENIQNPNGCHINPFSPNEYNSQSAVGGSGESELPRWNPSG